MAKGVGVALPFDAGCASVWPFAGMLPVVTGAVPALVEEVWLLVAFAGVPVPADLVAALLAGCALLFFVAAAVGVGDGVGVALPWPLALEFCAVAIVAMAVASARI